MAISDLRHIGVKRPDGSNGPFCQCHMWLDDKWELIAMSVGTGLTCMVRTDGPYTLEQVRDALIEKGLDVKIIPGCCPTLLGD